MAGIISIAEWLPETVVTNGELAAPESGWTAEKIFRKTGIRERRTATPGETALDLAERAAIRLFDSGVSRDKVDFLLLCTQSPDYRLPSSACLLQDRLGLSKSCGALDFNLGCSGFVYGLALAKGLLAGGIARQVLLVTADTYTKYLHLQDRSVRTIFGDGAAATLVSGDAGGIGEFSLGTDGSGAARLIVPAGGARRPSTAETAVATADASGNLRSPDNLFMDGPGIFNFTLDIAGPLLDAVLRKNGLECNDIDLFVFHQANRFMLEALRQTLRLDPEKFYINMEDIGNTVSSTIPIALARAQAQGKLRPGMKVLLAGFGVGLSWGGVVVEF